MSKRVSRRLVLVTGGALSVALLYAAVLHRYSAPGWDRFALASTEEGVAELAVKRDFLSRSVAAEKRYHALFR